MITRGPGEIPSVEELMKQGSELVVESADVIYPLSSSLVLFITFKNVARVSHIYIYIL